MDPVKIVARYVNGTLRKGFTQNFSPTRDRFHLYPTATLAGEGIEIALPELKAIFFVRDFAGDRQYGERKAYRDGERPAGQKVEVTFRDGEVLVGSTLGYNPSRPGFFLFPADPQTNNLRVFVVSTAVRSVRYL